jgi:hypothetical protein
VLPRLLGPTPEVLDALCRRVLEDDSPEVKAAAALALGQFGPPAAPAGVRGERAIRRDGELWSLEVDGKVVRVAHCKGMTLLAELLRRPGRDVHVDELLALDGERVASADLGPLADARARREYRRRIADLRAIAADAESQHDLVRAARAREEIEALRESLASAVGLGGRTRRPGGATERARLVVRKRLRVALARVRAVDPLLAHELEGAIRTGTLCTYRPAPDRAAPWRS